MRVSEKKIQAWQDAGIINQTQANRILEYEIIKNRSASFSTLMIFAANIIGLGCISIIAFNWYKVPDSLKLISDFAILLAVGVAAIYNSEKSIKFDLLALIYIILCLASIGLIAQIYNLSGPIYNTLFMWCAMTVLIVAATRYVFIWWLWLGTLIFAATIWYIDSSYMQYTLSGTILILNLFSTLSAIAVYSKPYSSSAFQYASRWWLITLLLAFIVSYEIYAEFLRYALHNSAEQASSPLIFFPVAMIVSIIPVILATIEITRIQKVLYTLLLSTITIFYLFGIYVIVNTFTAILLTTITLSLCSIIAVSMNRDRLFSFFIGLLGIRAIILYKQALGGMAVTGAGLIILGLLIIICAMLWRKYNYKLIQTITRWLNAK